MEVSHSKGQILGKRKRQQKVKEKEIDGFKKTKGKREFGSSEKKPDNEGGSEEELNNEDSSETEPEESSEAEPEDSSEAEPEDSSEAEPNNGDSSEAESNNEDSSKTESEGGSKAELREEFLISNLLRDALSIIRSKINVDDIDVRRSGLDIKEKFRDFLFTKVNFDLSENLIAYFYTYSLLNTLLSRNRFLDAFRNCQQLQKGIKKQNLNIISLGGGPGTDMIGFCSALQDFQLDSLKKLNITVVDLWKRWASFYHVLEFLIREGNYGNVSKLFNSKNIFSSFMTVDLLNQNPPLKYKRDLRAADIVLLVRVLDSFDFNEVRPEGLISKIVSEMKSGALLLLIDSVIRDYSDSEVTQVYKSNLDDYSLPVQQPMMFHLYTSKGSTAGISILKKK